jgi:hypothetical protein
MGNILDGDHLYFWHHIIRVWFDWNSALVEEEIKADYKNICNFNIRLI